MTSIWIPGLPSQLHDLEQTYEPWSLLYQIGILHGNYRDWHVLKALLLSAIIIINAFLCGIVTKHRDWSPGFPTQSDSKHQPQSVSVSFILWPLWGLSSWLPATPLCLAQGLIHSGHRLLWTAVLGLVGVKNPSTSQSQPQASPLPPRHCLLTNSVSWLPFGWT